MKKCLTAKYRIILFIGIIALLGCDNTKTFNDIDEFEKYVKGDNSPYLQTVTQNGIKVSLRYMPTEAMMINEYRHFLESREKLLKDNLLSKEQQKSKLNNLKNELLERKKAYGQSIYFHLTIGYEDESRDIVYEKMRFGHGAYSEWLQKLMFALQESIYLETHSIPDIPLNMYHMERTFGMRKSRTFLLVFPVQFNGHNVLGGDNEWLKLRVNEFGLGTGQLTFTYKVPFKKLHFQMNL